MAHVKKFTDEHRRRLREEGGKSMYTFAQGILGFKDMVERPHYELCENLDGRGTWGDWRRGLVTASRGFLKSSISTIAWPLRQGLYIPNWSCRILGSSFDNVKSNFFDKMQAIFQQSERRNFLLWLYGDPSDPEARIPDGFDGWTATQIVFKRTDPLASPAISYKGLNSDQEGYHGNAIIIDDPEGAEQEKGSLVTSEDAMKAVASIAPPLLINQARDRILVIATPHGATPLVYRLLEDKDGRIEWENSKRVWKQWFMPILDSEGKPTWPERYGEEAVKIIKATVDEKTWDQQYMLRKRSAGGSMVNFEAVKNSMFRWKIKGKVLEYPAMLMDEEKWKRKGKFVPSYEWRTAHVRELRYYMHVDFIHRKDTVGDFHRGNRPSKAAIVAVGVAPDRHCFVLGAWTEKCEPDAHFRQIYRYYARFGPYRVTFDPIGAQIWFKDYAVQFERDPRFGLMKTTGEFVPVTSLPRLSSRLEEDKRPMRAAKEQVVSDRLNPWFQSCNLHIDPEADELIHQLKGFPDDSQYVDLVDALAQGPPIWEPPAPKFTDQVRAKKDALLRRVVDKYTGFYSPYRQKDPAGINEILEPPNAPPS